MASLSLYPHRSCVVRMYVYWNTETSTADLAGRDLRHLPSWLLQLREIPDVAIVEILVTCARTVCPPQKGEKVMTSSPLGIVCAVARAGIGQRNATLNSIKMANPFRETSEGTPAPVPPTPIRAFRTAINIREFEEMPNFRPSCSHPRKRRVGLGHHQ